MAYYGSILDANGTSPGVQRLHSPQSTEAAATQAVQEQAHGDEFKPQESPDVAVLVARLNELQAKNSVLWTELCGPPNSFMQSKPYTGPPYLERERKQLEIDQNDREIASIQMQLREIVEAAGLNVESGSPFAGTARVNQ